MADTTNRRNGLKVIASNKQSETAIQVRASGERPPPPLRQSIGRPARVTIESSMPRLMRALPAGKHARQRRSAGCYRLVLASARNRARLRTDLRAARLHPPGPVFVVVALGAGDPPASICSLRWRFSTLACARWPRSWSRRPGSGSPRRWSRTPSARRCLVVEGGPAFRLARKELPGRSGAAVTEGRSEAEDRQSTVPPTEHRRRSGSPNSASVPATHGTRTASPIDTPVATLRSGLLSARRLVPGAFANDFGCPID